MSRQARLGLVVLTGAVLFIGALFVLANRTYLLSDTYTVRAQFDRVGGLLPGATTYLNGVSVGRVESVNLPSAPGQPIEVVLRVRDDARPLIRTDSRANIQTDGLVGSVIVALTDGSPSRPIVAEGGRIEGVEPFDITLISDRAFESVARFDSVTVTLTQIMQDVQGGEGSLGRFLYDDRLYEETILTTQELRGSLVGLSNRADLSLQQLTTRADAVVAVAQEAGQNVNSLILRTQTGQGSLARLLNEDSVYTALLRSADQFSTISADLGTITGRFEQAAGWAAVGAFRFSENMEALKHNFLFRSYFEDRGYLEMAPFEVRERALEETYQELQEWERRLYREQQELERVRAEGGGRPPAAVTPASAPAPRPGGGPAVPPTSGD